MSRDPVSINIDDHDMWEQRKARLRTLESVNGTQHQVEFKCLALVHTAAREGNLDEFIKAVEKYSAEENASLSDIISTEGPSRNSLLHIAAGIENADILQILLEVIDDKQLAAQTNDRWDTPLHVAARAGRFRMVKLLLDFGSDVDEANKARNTALHEAVKNGDLELTDLLLSRGSKSVNKKNWERKCPLYLAVETGNLEILLRLLQEVDENEVLSSEIEGMSPVHGAVMHRKLDMLRTMSERKKELFDLRIGGGNTPLHLAAYENYVEGVEFLVDKFSSSAFEHNSEGYLPIHVACKMGHLETIKKLLQHWPYPEELCSLRQQQNILHVAAEHGRATVVKYILGDPKLEKLLNAKDQEGNTPLHVATKKWQYEVLLFLTRDKRVDLKLVNHRNLTALDIVDAYLTVIDAPIHQSLTRTILVTAGAPRSKDKAVCYPQGLGQGEYLESPDLNRLKDAAEIRMVVATLIAAMTFASGFSVPGGFNGSEPDAGIATLLNKPMYGVFVTCNSIALYSSIIAVVILLWTQINDSNGVHHALRKARIPLLIALATMSVAFMAGVYVTVSKRTWLAVVTLVIGITALIVILGLYIALFVPLRYNSRFVQPFADYIIKAGISISRRTKGSDPIMEMMVLAAPPPEVPVDEDRYGDGDGDRDEDGDGDEDEDLLTEMETEMKMETETERKTETETC
ncbi:hypothetical protein NL676_020941 [Syzygium grande]|nr:hypothetical protein NL676_020941 [Syzygium grande]